MNFDLPAGLSSSHLVVRFSGVVPDERAGKASQSPRQSLVTGAGAFAIPHQPIYHFPQMARFAKVVVALLCIVCVPVLSIAPFVDIPVTVLRSLQLVLLLMLSLMANALTLVILFQQVLRLFSRVGCTCPDNGIQSLRLPLLPKCVLQC